MLGGKFGFFSLFTGACNFTSISQLLRINEVPTKSVFGTC